MRASATWPAGVAPAGLERAPTRDELFDIRLRGSRFTLDALKALPSGIVVDSPELQIQPAREGADALLDPMPADVAAEIAEFFDSEVLPSSARDEGSRPFFSHLLSSRRMRELFCSTGRHFPDVKKRRPYNPVQLMGSYCEGGNRNAIVNGAQTAILATDTVPGVK